MRLSENIKVKTGIAAWIPYLSVHTAQALYPNIYLPKRVYDNLGSSKPRLRYLAVLAHEQKHLEREKKMGPFRWGMKYSFLPKFRFQEELIAAKSEMGVYKKHGKEFNIKKRAKYLSGWLYFRPVSYETAKKELEKMWSEI